MSSALEIDGLSKRFGGVHAVEDVSFQVESGQILGLIGPNGSGKTTLLNMIAGTLRPSSGDVDLHGQRVTSMNPHRKVARGIARTFQSTRVFGDWTVRETLQLAGTSRSDTPGTEEIAEFVGISTDLDREVRSLPSAIQRLVMVASALATGPRLLLLDEPAVGMDVGETDHLRDIIRGARDDLGATTIVVEHNMRFLMALADTVLVMASGKVLASGTPQEVRNDPAVVTAYLGS